jgi:hypothetical protein
MRNLYTVKTKLCNRNSPGRGKQQWLKFILHSQWQTAGPCPAAVSTVVDSSGKELQKKGRSYRRMKSTKAKFSILLRTILADSSEIFTWSLTPPEFSKKLQAGHRSCKIFLKQIIFLVWTYYSVIIILYYITLQTSLLQEKLTCMWPRTFRGTWYYSRNQKIPISKLGNKVKQNILLYVCEKQF